MKESNTDKKYNECEVNISLDHSALAKGGIIKDRDETWTEEVEQKVSDLLTLIGEDTTRDGLIGTPNRVARMYKEVFRGYHQDPMEILSTRFQEEHQELVMERGIPFYSMCEHHMIPFFGKAHIAYIPNGEVVGISKLVRLVECFARRLQIQERMTSQIADTIERSLKPAGVAVILEAEHLCMSMRGVRTPGVNTVTSALRGLFKLDEKARQEILILMRGESK